MTTTTPSSEVFALTDEQILGVEPEEVVNGPLAGFTAETQGKAEFHREEKKNQDPPSTTEGGAPAVLQEAPVWLAERMRDPWVGEEARELWEGAQKAQREAAEYREVFGSTEDARALKEIYPGGVAEAKNAAERARELAEIDAVIFGAPGRGAEELRAGRVQLVERLHAQDPAALREMVEAGARLLEAEGSGRKVASGEWRAASGREEKAEPTSTRERTPNGTSSVGDAGAHAGVPVAQEVSRYREFERVANAELEKSVGSAIGRAMEAALPNLKQLHTSGQAGAQHAAPLQETLAAAVREDVEAALKSDAGLGEQVARVLSGRRFDEASREQVVRLIDARAQQLVLGAVRRVVGSWTAATLGTKKTEPGGGEQKTAALRRTGNDEQKTARTERPAAQESGRKSSRGRMDYRKWSDEEILGM